MIYKCPKCKRHHDGEYYVGNYSFHLNPNPMVEKKDCRECKTTIWQSVKKWFMGV